MVDSTSGSNGSNSVAPSRLKTDK